MWLLGRLLPLMCVPEDDAHWICFINILRILCIATAFEITPDAVSMLQMLIEDYLYQFNMLYPNSITPKLHYLLQTDSIVLTLCLVLTFFINFLSIG